MTYPLKLVGGPGSPYSRKMRAVLRYRRIPHRWILRNSRFDVGIPEVNVPIIPVLAFPDADGNYTRAMTDSSPQIMVLEEMFSERSLVPTDPVVAFLDYLVEDYADEWCTKMMYHYRWYHPDAIDKAGKLLPIQGGLQVPDDQWAEMTDFITTRQIDRRALVGSTEDNVAIIEGSYVRLLHILDDHLRDHDFLWGDRPARGDFGLFGQLSQLTWWDTEAVAVAVNEAPRVVAWVERNDDISWWETDEDFVDRDRLAATIRPLLTEIGRTYAPFMVANHAAFAGDEESMHCIIDGTDYSQARFGYQRKCLDWLRDLHAGLADADRADVDAALAGTGCDQLF